MLTFANLKTDLLQMIGSKSGTSRTDILTAVTGAIRRATEAFARYGEWGCLSKFTDRVYIPLSAPYTTGTVTATQDSKTIAGSSTVWTRDMEESFFRIGSNEWYEIRTFTSATSIDLVIPYQSSSAAAQTYTIAKRFYNLPLDFIYPIAEQAKLATPGSDSESPMKFSMDASFYDQIVTGKPTWYAISGNTRSADYFNTGTVTVATSGGVSTWTISSGTLPTDIVDRQVRIVGESRAYYIKTRATSATFTTYETYVNPSDATNTQSTASSYAITPKETPLVGFSNVPDTRYVFDLPYKALPPEMLSDNDISPIIAAGYERAFVAMCRRVLAEDARVALRGDMVTNLIAASTDAMAEAWDSECREQTALRQQAGYRSEDIQVGPSWMGR